VKRIVIIGGVAGGMSAATRLRRLDDTSEIIVLERSGYVSYANCGLPYFIGGVIENEADLLLQTPDSLFDRFRLDVRIHSEALTINPLTKVIAVRNLETNQEYLLNYDKLILSPGANPIVPPIPGIERAHTLRTVEDVERITVLVANNPKHAVVIGGGFIGLEVAENLVHRKISTTIIEASGQLLAPLDPEMAILVLNEVRNYGVEVRLNTSAVAINENFLTLSGGESIAADLVILAIGVKPDTALAKAAGLEIGSRGGISTDEHNRTSNSDIYAIGDAAEKTDALDGSASLVPLANIANRHGRIVADHIYQRQSRLVDTIGTAIVKVFDLAIATTGWNEKRLAAAGRKFDIIHTHPNSHAGYYPGAKPMTLKMIFHPDSGEIYGAQGVGYEGVDKRIDVLATAIRAGITAPELADLELAYAPPFGSAKDPVNMLGYIAENRISRLVTSVQWHEIQGYTDRGYQILDVRTPGEFELGSIESAINLPLDSIRDRHQELTNQNILVLCHVGQRAHTATLLLKDLGYNSILIDGGYLTWSHSPAALIA
jgi:NADPH-dependent 2,4-dienoyl-CoA reductase/sulfur reductase-like enzyme/rhodanese-related sulfurtransferase